MKAIRNCAFVDIIVMSTQWYAARVGIFITIVAYVFLGNKITVEKAFMITAFYNDLKNCMNIMFTFGKFILFIYFLLLFILFIILFSN